MFHARTITQRLAFGSVSTAVVWTVSNTVEAKETEPSSLETKLREELVDLFEKDNAMGPTLVRLAWHSSGTFDKSQKSLPGCGGSANGTIRFQKELSHGGNAGLHKATAALEPLKQKFPSVSYADLYILAGVTMIEEMGGPSVPFSFGRVDAKSDEEVTRDGRLPDADKGPMKCTIQHIRDVFYRMGFNDREIVALVGAHAIGRCYPDRSGFKGPWTRAEWTFSNEFFVQLLNNKWTMKKWDGPDQFEDETGDLMMLPADMAFLWDKEFRKYVEIYAKDEDVFFEDFAKAFQKLTENGVKTLVKNSSEKKSGGWTSFFSK